MSRSVQAQRSARSRAHSRHRVPLHVVRRNKQGLIKRGRARKIAPALVLMGILIAATIGTILLEQVVLAQSAFKLSGIREELEQAEEQHSQLLLEAAKLGSSERIKRVAVEVLGMVPPEEAGGTQYIVANVRSDWSNTLARSSDAAAARHAGEGIAASDAVLGAGSP